MIATGRGADRGDLTFTGAHLLLGNVWRTVVAALMAFWCAVAVAETSVSQLNLAAGADRLWVIVGGPDPEQHRLVQQFGWLERSDGKVQPVSLIDPQPGRVARTAVMGDDLHVFYQTGAHDRYSLRGEHRERRMADHAAPLALTGDSGQPGQLWALVHVDTAREIAVRLREEEQRRQDRAERRRRGRWRLLDSQPAETQTATSRPSTTRIVTSQPIELGEGAFYLVRYDGARWHPAIAGPPGMARVDEAWLCEGGGQFHLLWRESPADRKWQYARGREDAWIEGEQFVPPPLSNVVACSATKDGVCVTLASTRGVDEKLVWFETWRSRATDGDAPVTWMLLPGPESPEGEPVTVAEGATAVVWKDYLAILAPGDEGPLFGIWPLTGGEAVVPPGSLPRALSSGEKRSDPRWGELARLLALGMLVFLVFWRRQDSLVHPPRLPDDVEIAGLLKRAAATACDLLPAVAIVALGWRGPIEEFLEEIEYLASAGARLETIEVPMTLWVASFTFSGVYTLWCLVFELLIGTTPGKRLLGLRVISETGSPPRRTQIVGRNLMRLVEFEPHLYFWPFLIVVLLNPFHQRIGDLVAKTVVIEDRPRVFGPGDDEEGRDESNAGDRGTE